MKEFDANKETISAMLDDELQSNDCERCACLIKEEAGLRETWDTYLLIGDLMRGTPPVALPGSFAERIKAEPTVLAPRVKAVPRRAARYAFTAAAAAAGIGFVTWISMDLLPGQRPEVAMSRAHQAVATFPAGATTGTAPQNNRVIEEYLLAHQPFSLTSSMQGVAPYVQTVSEQSESAKQ